MRGVGDGRRGDGRGALEERRVWRGRGGGSGRRVSSREGKVGGRGGEGSMAAVREGGGDEGLGKGDKSVCEKLTDFGQGTVATL